MTHARSKSSNELKVSSALTRNSPSPTFGSCTLQSDMTRVSSRTSLASEVKTKLKEEIDDLKKQYIKLKQRQLQAQLILEGKGAYLLNVLC